MSKIKKYFNQPVSNAPLIVFRIIFGALACYGAIRVLVYDWVEPLYQTPTFYFTYLGFDWVQPLSGDWMYLPFLLMIIGGLGIAFGALYRFSALLYFLSFTYVELLDKTNYLNHYYLFSLLAFLMILVPANHRFSLDVRWKLAQPTQHVARGFILVLQIQLACVYFFAGIAKINGDWLLEAQPLSTWLQSHRDLPIVGAIFASKTTAYLFSWFGCLYDLTIPFLLWWSKTRKWAFSAVVVFHLLTAFLFPIGIFPYVMIGLTTLFFASDWHERWLPKSHSDMSSSMHPLLRHFFVLFLFIQLLLPFRYLLYPGKLFWNEEGFRFSWRVMLMHKEGLATFYVKDSKTGGEIEIDNSQYLNRRQIEQMSTQPDMILQFAHYLRDKFADTTLIINGTPYPIINPSVHADVFVTLNGRPARKMVDRSTDLTKETYHLKHREWVIPFEK